MEEAEYHQHFLNEHDSIVSHRLRDVSGKAVEDFLSSTTQKPLALRLWLRAVAWELRLLWLLSGSSIVISCFCNMLGFVTLMFAGHLGTIELAGASITCIGIQGLAYGIMCGMASAVQTMCGQAYGAKKYATMGIICQQAIFLQLGAAFLLSFLFWFSGAFLQAIGQSESITEQGQVFAHGVIPQLYAFAIMCPMHRFLQAQNIVNPVACMTVCVCLLHILLTWLVVYVLDYGLLGAALTLSFSWWLLAVLIALYIYFSPLCKHTWSGLSWKAFKGIWPYLKLTFASAVMQWQVPIIPVSFINNLEIWYYNGLVLISGFLPDPAISVDSISICMSCWNWDTQFMLGLAAAASVRVSNELGAAHPMVAKFSVFVVNGSSIFISSLFTVVVLVFKVGLTKLFTSDPKVIKAVTDLTPLLAISVFLNGIQPILSGVAVGSGWQAVVAYVNLAAYYLVGLPLGCVIGFKTSLGVAGIWWGMILGVLLQTTTLIIITARTNWNLEVEKSVERLWNAPSDDAAKLNLMDNI
ncbi:DETOXIFICATION 41-like protein [Drosera capensis]